MEHTQKWRPIEDYIGIAIIVLLAVSQIAIAIRDGGWEMVAAIALVLSLGAAS